MFSNLDDYTLMLVMSMCMHICVIQPSQISLWLMENRLFYCWTQNIWSWRRKIIVHISFTLFVFVIICIPTHYFNICRQEKIWWTHAFGMLKIFYHVSHKTQLLPSRDANTNGMESLCTLYACCHQSKGFNEIFAS